MNVYYIERENYFIRDAKSDELDLYKSLVEENEKSFFDSDNIWFEQSKVCVDKKTDEIIAFGLIRPNSICKFFKNEITEGVNFREKPNWLKNDIKKCKGESFEVLFFIKDEKFEDNYSLQIELGLQIEEDKKGNRIENVFWTKNKPKFISTFYNLNDIVYINTPFYEQIS